MAREGDDIRRCGPRNIRDGERGGKEGRHHLSRWSALPRAMRNPAIVSRSPRMVWPALPTLCRQMRPAGHLEEPAQRFETEEQATCHLVGSQGPDDVLVHCQDVAQAAVEWTLLIDGSAPCRLVDELHHIDADADDVRIGAGEQCKLPLGGLPRQRFSKCYEI